MLSDDCCRLMFWFFPVTHRSALHLGSGRFVVGKGLFSLGRFFLAGGVFGTLGFLRFVPRPPSPPPSVNGIFTLFGPRTLIPGPHFWGSYLPRYQDSRPFWAPNLNNSSRFRGVLFAALSGFSWLFEAQTPMSRSHFGELLFAALSRFSPFLGPKSE